MAAPGNWLLVTLKGTGRTPAPSAPSSRVKAGALTMTRLVQSGTSYISQDDKRQHFGLGTATQADSIEVLLARRLAPRARTR